VKRVTLFVGRWEWGSLRSRYSSAAATSGTIGSLADDLWARDPWSTHDPAPVCTPLPDRRGAALHPAGSCGHRRRARLSAE